MTALRQDRASWPVLSILLLAVQRHLGDGSTQRGLQTWHAAQRAFARRPAHSVHTGVSVSNRQRSRVEPRRRQRMQRWAFERALARSIADTAAEFKGAQAIVHQDDDHPVAAIRARAGDQHEVQIALPETWAVLPAPSELLRWMFLRVMDLWRAHEQHGGEPVDAAYDAVATYLAAALLDHGYDIEQITGLAVE